MKKVNKKIGIAAATAGVVAGAVAAGVAIYRRNKNESVYHEEELRAMNELDDMNAETFEGAAEECANENCDACESCESCEEENAAEDAEEAAPCCCDGVCTIPGTEEVSEDAEEESTSEEESDEEESDEEEETEE